MKFLRSLYEARSAGKLSAERTTFRELHHMVQKNDQEGLVFLGAGGDLSEWIEGITDMLADAGIAISKNPAEVWNGAYVVETSGGRTDLVLMFGDDTLQVGKLAMWRIQFGDATWLSDYVVNYRDQH